MAGQYCPEGSPFWQACPGGSYCADATGTITGLCAEGYYCEEVGPAPSDGQCYHRRKPSASRGHLLFAPS